MEYCILNEPNSLEELANRLAETELAINIKTACMGRATTGADQRIAELEHDLKVLREHRADVAEPYATGIAEDKRRIEALHRQILYEWDGDKKTHMFDSGTLKFRTTYSLKICDPGMVLTGLLDHTSMQDVAMNYITGFNKTAVKKFMSVIPLPIGSVELEPKTTVKLDRIEGAV